jgi:Na+-transporting methylmalonyl-CoA/oxaloacetate decarboxylase gamma subunit
MMTFILIFLVFLAGLGCGYGVREVVSRRRHTAARARYYKEKGLDLPKNVPASEALRQLVDAILFKPSQRKPK